MAEPKLTKTGLAYDIIDLVAPWSKGRRPVVFHHGIGTDRHVWTAWLPSIVTGHAVIRFDTRGYGQSAVPPVDHAWTLDGALADLMEIVDLAGHDGPVHLVGESFGGTAALYAAIRHPDRIASLTVSNTAFRGATIADVPGWRKAFVDPGVKAWSADMMHKRFHDGAIEPAQRQWYQAVQDRSPAHVTVGLGELLAATDLGPQLGRIKAPMLILMPDRSPFVTARMGIDLLEAVPHADLAMIPHARHGLPFSHAAECGRRLAAHLERVEAGLA
ncbi:MAG: alpha/beta hydrolase [Hyphomicrobiaceae bacterium]|nr:alpha/beta hydrolase [Hyphomicrobiaceae bacterium]